MKSPMKISLGEYTCGSCNSTFEAPMLSETSYGEFLLWSAKGNVAYLNAIKDEVYSEFEELLLKNFSELKDSENKRVEVLQREFGPITCDPDNSGENYKIGMFPTCPFCDESCIKSWQVSNPLKYTDYEIPHVTHANWKQMNLLEKNCLINSILP